METAIQKAREGGYRYKDQNYKDWIHDTSHEEILLDPLFWQALGKQQGWNRYSVKGFNDVDNYFWLQHWHSLIDHIAEGKEIDLFFNELLK